MVEIVLRPFEEDDFSFIVDAISSADELLQWAGPGFSWPLDEEQLRDYRNRAAVDPDTFLTFSVTEAAGGAVVGHVQLVLDRRHDFGHIGRVLVAPTARGRGLGTALMREVVRLGFSDLKLHRLTLNVFDFNEAAIRCYERVGFIKEGYLRDARRGTNGYWSMFVSTSVTVHPDRVMRRGINGGLQHPYTSHDAGSVSRTRREA